VAIASIFRARAEVAQQLLDGVPQDATRTIEFRTSALRGQGSTTSIHRKLPGKDEGHYHIYTVRLTSEESATHNLCSQLFQAFRQSGEANASRFNATHRASPWLYVGSSKDVRGRFRSHLGVGRSRTTWGMYLSLWLSEIDETVAVDVLKIPTADSDLIEFIETGIWDTLRPMFGKKGGK
jgi:hypothetical protein